MTASGTAPYECMTCGFIRASAFPLECPKCGEHGVYAKASMQSTPGVEVAASGSLIVAEARADPTLPEILMQALLTFDGATSEGQLVAAVGNAWFRILALLRRDPSAGYQMDPRKWEEFIAGAYEQDGYEVVLTPRSSDKGRDVIATRKGVGQIRIFDQVKRYAPNRVVSADEVRAFLWVVHAGRASKGFMTTTSTFAPLLLRDDYIAPFIPSLVELRPRDALFDWLDELAKR